MTDLHTETAAVVETRLVHGLHRRATTLLAESAARAATPSDELGELRDFVVAALRHHHQSEDEQLWPMVVAVAPDLVSAFAELERDHARLDAALDLLAAASIDDLDRGDLVDAAATVRDLVHAHLDREEPVLLPVLGSLLPIESWDAFSRYTVESAPPETAPLMVAFLDRVGTPAEVDLVLDHLPAPARERVPALRAQGDAVLARLGEARS